MRLVPVTGDQLQRILDETFPLWGEGLSRRGYEQWNQAQQQTLWGQRHLTRLALIDGDTVVATAKRYDLTMTVNGRATRTLGIGAVFTPRKLRGRGHATAIVRAMEDAARADGVEAALLFSEIGSAFYEKLGFTTVPVQTVDIAVARGKGAPAMLVRSGEDRDAEHVAAMHAARATDYTVALLPGAAQIIYSVVKKRLFVGLHPSRHRRIEYFVAEEGHQAVAGREPDLLAVEADAADVLDAVEGAVFPDDLGRGLFHAALLSPEASVLAESEPNLQISCFDAFSSREPASASLENAPIAP